MTKCELCNENIGFLFTPFSVDKDGYKYETLCKNCYDAIEERIKEEQSQKNEVQENSPLKNILFISSSSFENCKIERYFDIITSEVVLGTGIFSEFGSGIDDFLGTRGTAFEKKIIKAQEMARKELKTKALKLGANAIISGKLDYEVIGKNMILLIATGTPVVTSKEEVTN